MGVGAGGVAAALPGDRERRLDAVEHRIDTAVDRYAPYVGLVIGLALTPPFLADGPAWAWVAVGVLVPATAAWCAVLHAVQT